MVLVLKVCILTRERFKILSPTVAFEHSNGCSSCSFPCYIPYKALEESKS
jgi:hypothetical protein